MYVGHHYFELAFIVGFHLADAEGDSIVFTVGDEFESTTFNDLSHTLVELEGWRWVTLDLDRDITVLIYKRLIFAETARFQFPSPFF